MPKNIVVFSDGTGQEGGKKHSTNVYKLFKMVERRSKQQKAFYDAGVGTELKRRVTGNISGRGIQKNIGSVIWFPDVVVISCEKNIF